MNGRLENVVEAVEQELGLTIEPSLLRKHMVVLATANHLKLLNATLSPVQVLSNFLGW